MEIVPMADDTRTPRNALAPGPLTIRGMQDELDMAINQTAEKYRMQIMSLEKRVFQLQETIKENQDKFNEERGHLVSMMRSREGELEKQIEEINNLNFVREKDFLAKLKKSEDNYNEKMNILSTRAEELRIRERDLEAEIIRISSENQENLKSNSASFVNATLKDLNTKEKSLSTISLSWSVIGGLLLFGACLTIGAVTIFTVRTVHAEMSWALVGFYALKGTVLLGVVGVASRYAFVLSQRYMEESLRTADRIHAIKFGQLYVETYGAAANWDQVKDAFANWDGAGRFQTEPEEKSPLVDPKISESIALLDKVKMLVS